MSPSWATFLFEAANFLLLAAVLGWAFFRPVRDALERRRAALEAEQREAAEKRSQAERALAEATAQRSEFESSLAALRARAREEAERERARVLEAAREQGQRERATLETELAALRRGQAKQLARDAAAAAREVVARLLEHIDGPDLEQALGQAACRELAALAAKGPLASVIVEAPADLAPELLDSLARSGGIERTALSTRQVPELGAGLRVLTSRGLIDASAAGLAAYAERGLVARLEQETSGDV